MNKYLFNKRSLAVAQGLKYGAPLWRRTSIISFLTNFVAISESHLNSFLRLFAFKFLWYPTKWTWIQLFQHSRQIIDRYLDKTFRGVYIYIYMCVCVYVCVRESLYLCVCKCLFYMHVCIACIYVCVSVCVCGRRMKINI